MNSPTKVQPLDRAVKPPLEIIVYGLPATQGNHRVSRAGAIYETTKNHKPWREAVKWAAREAFGNGVRPIIPGPVMVQMTFTLPKPKSAPKRRVTLPDRKPDLSKLVRSTEDALTDVCAWEDDARVVSIQAAKRYPDEGPNALPSPGAVIRIMEAA